MNTIRQLAMEWWNNLLPIADSETLNKTALCEQYYGFERTHQSLTGREIENIFYNEVIIKWFHNDYYNTLVTSEAGYRANLMTADDIISLYLKEHSKEEPALDFKYCKNEIEGGNKCYVQCDHCKEYYAPLEMEQPLSVNKDVEVDGETLESKVRNLFSPIKNYIAVSRQLLSDNEDTKLVKLAQEEGLRADQNIYAIISEVHNAAQPKVEDNSWDEVLTKFFYYLKYNKGIEQLEDSMLTDFQTTLHIN